MMRGDPVPESSFATLLPSKPGRTHWLRRAFDGINRQRVATVLALCVCWALSVTLHDLLPSWHANGFAGWLRDEVGGEFACIVVIAMVSAAPLVAAGNLGPQSGWRRMVLLALMVACVAAPLATGVRLAYHFWSDDGLDGFTPFALFTLWERYVEMTGLFTVVVEFQRREARSIESMHQAEIDRLALEHEMDEARLQVLQAQIEPHFLFNTLANVRRLYQTDPANGRIMLRNLMRYLEVALPHMREARSTVGREIALVEAYLAVQQIRMGRRLSFRIDVAPTLQGAELPPMMVLTLVENAIKHGLNPLSEGGRMVIRAGVDAVRLRIDVADDGRGFQASSGGGTGLANIRARLAAMFGDAAGLTLAENLPRGITATLLLPLTRPATA